MQVPMLQQTVIMKFIAYHIAFMRHTVLLIYSSRKALHNDNREWCVLIVGSPPQTIGFKSGSFQVILQCNHDRTLLLSQ